MQSAAEAAAAEAADEGEEEDADADDTKYGFAPLHLCTFEPVTRAHFTIAIEALLSQRPVEGHWDMELLVHVSCSVKAGPGWK